MSYALDGVGNRLARASTVSGIPAQTFTYNSNDWISSEVFDTNGNVRTNANGRACLYDFDDRLTNFDNGSATFVYNADGIRVKKIAGGTATLYLVDNHNPTGYPQVLEEFTVSAGTTNLSACYTFGLRLISERKPSLSTNFFVYDGHGNTRLLSDFGGNSVETYSYDAYGALIAGPSSPSRSWRRSPADGSRSP